MFFDRLSQLCEEKDISVYKLAELVGLNRGAANRWRKGSVPVADNLQKIADYFEVTTDYLISGDETTLRESETENIGSPSQSENEKKNTPPAVKQGAEYAKCLIDSLDEKQLASAIKMLLDLSDD